MLLFCGTSAHLILFAALLRRTLRLHETRTFTVTCDYIYMQLYIYIYIIQASLQLTYQRINVPPLATVSPGPVVRCRTLPNECRTNKDKYRYLFYNYVDRISIHIYA